MSNNIKLLFHTNLNTISTISYDLPKNENRYIKASQLLHILKQQLDYKLNKNTILPFFDTNIDNCLLKYQGKVVYSTQRINLEILETESENDILTIEFDVFFRLKGGFFQEILDGIVYFFDQILFNPILYPLLAVVKLIELVFWKIPIYLIKLLIWGFRFMAWFITEVCSPQQLVDDFGTIITTLVFSIVSAIFDVIKFLIKKVVNTVGPTIFNGFWGWDQVQDSQFDREQAAYFDPENNRFTQKNYTDSNNKIPTSIIIGTVIFPPLGVFMEYGLSGWVQIMISGFLTLCFYFPGLIYALICLYC